LASDYDSFADMEFFVSEKLDGTSFTAFVDQDFGVCGRNWQYAEDAKNSYWQAVGPGIQGNRYKLKQQTLFVFNVFDIENYGYLEKDEMNSICQRLGVEVVPFIEVRKVPETIEEILSLAEGKSVLNAQAEREGLVWVNGYRAEPVDENGKCKISKLLLGTTKRWRIRWRLTSSTPDSPRLYIPNAYQTCDTSELGITT